jgi:hypothetical protein
MTLKKWLTEEKIKTHQTSLQEIMGLFKLADRDLVDAQIESLSPDRRYATAYNAALQLATIILVAAGYRTSKAGGHHWLTFRALPEIMGSQIMDTVGYFDTCRVKRNKVDYVQADIISESEVIELIEEVIAFQKEVIKWLFDHHPQLLPPAE